MQKKRYVADKMIEISLLPGRLGPNFGEKQLAERAMILKRE
jgi:hypothetical protein